MLLLGLLAACGGAPSGAGYLTPSDGIARGAVPDAEARKRFDGRYAGRFHCEQGSSSVAARGRFLLEVRDGQIDYRRAFMPPGIEGEERTSGEVREDGSFILQGELRGRALRGPAAGRPVGFELRYDGRIGDGGLEAAGQHVSDRWARPCRMVGRRLAA
ncbi:MAG: hypothetical protein KIT81_17545 [Alphaproteobacteria bacterium]|nr:hypothetical protein [Alphaproteobacteria bacterium]